MTRLKQVLETTLPDVTNLGGGRNVDRDVLIELLRKLGGDLGLAYWLRSAVSFVVLAILLVVIARYSSQPTVLATASTAWRSRWSGRSPRSKRS